MSDAVASVLDRILAQTRQEVERRRRARPLPLNTRESIPRDDSPGRFRAALETEGIGVIAEFKRRSPSAGTLREQPQLPEIVRAYERGGALAASILTEEANFDGSLDDLREARAECSLPLLRKDFIVDDYQLHEAVAAGADAVLLIVAALSDDELGSLQAAARALGLDVLTEVHDRVELRRALELGAEIIGINNRDLRDFSVDVSRTEALMEDLPSDVIAVSESGITDAEQVRRLDGQGVSAVLVGETLMRSTDPAAAVRALTAWRHEMI